MLIPRLVAFKDGRAVCAGCAAEIARLEGCETAVFMLPSENVDFIDVDVRGKTAEELRAYE